MRVALLKPIPGVRTPMERRVDAAVRTAWSSRFPVVHRRVIEEMVGKAPGAGGGYDVGGPQGPWWYSMKVV